MSDPGFSTVAKVSRLMCKCPDCDKDFSLGNIHDETYEALEAKLKRAVHGLETAKARSLAAPIRAPGVLGIIKKALEEIGY